VNSTRTAGDFYLRNGIQRRRRCGRLRAEYRVQTKQGCSAIQGCLPAADALWDTLVAHTGVYRTHPPEKSRIMTLRNAARARVSKTLNCIHVQPCLCQISLKRAKGWLLECVYCCEYCWMRQPTSARAARTNAEDVK